MPFINGFFYPDEVKIGQPPDLGGMIAKAMAMRQARQQAQMQQERDKMGMDLDRMKLAGAKESQRKEGEYAKAMGKLADAYKSSQSMPAEVKMPNLGGMFGGAGGFNVPGMIPTTVPTGGQMTPQDLQKEAAMLMMQAGDPDKMAKALEMLAPQQRGISFDQRMDLREYDRQTQMEAIKARAESAKDRVLETYRLKEAGELNDREFAVRMQQDMRNFQWTMNEYNKQWQLSNRPQQLVDITGPDGRTYKAIVPPGGGAANPLMFNPPGQTQPVAGNAPAPNLPPEPSGNMTNLFDENIGDANGTTNPAPLGGKVGGMATPPDQVMGYDEKTGEPTGMVDTRIPTMNVKPPAIPLPNGPVPAMAPAKSGPSGDLDVRNERLRTNWLRSPGYVKSQTAMDSAEKVERLADSIKASAAAGEPVGIQQLMVLWNSIQTVDQSVVKEGEAAMFKAAQGLMVNLQNKLSEMNRDPAKVNMLAQSAIDEFVKVSRLMKQLSKQSQEKYRRQFNDTYQREVIPDVYGGNKPSFDPAGMKPFKRKGEAAQSGWYDESTETMYNMNGEVMK